MISNVELLHSSMHRQSVLDTIMYN